MNYCQPHENQFYEQLGVDCWFAIIHVGNLAILKSVNVSLGPSYSAIQSVLSSACHATSNILAA
jgi:hypothetical protein